MKKHLEGSGTTDELLNEWKKNKHLLRPQYKIEFEALKKVS